MALRIAIVGPGRVGTAFARGFADSGARVLGFVGRDRARTARCLAQLGSGEVLDWADLARAHVVVFAVGDEDLPAAVQSAAAVGGRAGSLWLHTSGRHDLEVFGPALPLSVRVGSLHPLLPFPDTQQDHTQQGHMQQGHAAGALALLAGLPRSMRLLRRLCGLLGFEPLECGEQDRVLYHAACALMANGLTALFGLVVELFETAGGLDAGDGERITAALARAALLVSARDGAAAGLSGPVRRGDAATVQQHVTALTARAAAAVPAYRALMHQALRLAASQGLPAAHHHRIATVLGPSG